MPAGLVNGTSIIEFATEEDLKQKILLPSRSHGRRVAIAGQGREAAMTRHRTWHRIEEIFGSCPSVQINCAAVPGLFGRKRGCDDEDDEKGRVGGVLYTN
jgi:hypothetical protein